MGGAGPTGEKHGAEYWHLPGLTNGLHNGFWGMASVFVNAAFASGGVEMVGIVSGESAMPVCGSHHFAPLTQDTDMQQALDLAESNQDSHVEIRHLLRRFDALPLLRGQVRLAITDRRIRCSSLTVCRCH